MARPPRSLIVFLVAVTLVRLCAAAFIPLSEDEAYYRLWAGSLQFGYFDHPPMIAWWVRAGMSIAGDNALGVRLLPVLSSGLASLVVFDIAGGIGAGERVAARAAVWFNATLLIGVGGFLAIPDAPNILFWALTLACLTRIDGPGGGAWWLAAGVAAGLATLSKYSALFIAPGVLLWIALKPGGWRELRRPWPWGAALIAVAIFGVNIAWNAGHHWVTFIKQFGRAAPAAFAPENLLWFLGGQLVLLNPYIAWFTGRGAILVWRRKAPARIDLGLVLNTGLPFIAYLLLHSLHDRVEAHWTAPLYPALAILGAWAAETVPAGSYLGGIGRRAGPIGLAICALVLVHLAVPATDVGLADPALAFRGWRDLAARVEALRLANNAAWVGTLSYATTAQLAASGKIHSPVIELRERDRYPPGDPSWRADLTQPGIVVDLDRRAADQGLGGCFMSIRPLPPLTRGDPGKPGVAYATLLVSGSRAGAGGDCDSPATRQLAR
ncbi:MAG TPA: glycosyltransferase family 39 protein [Caulobacteraceae bacterium]|jgi:4-amino-4-deoxy-L-arabinose transferase-like glycosyltransferase|nr:glycosyltransferase family 39 protein [Caulobacteraceae bacterium]